MGKNRNLYIAAVIMTCLLAFILFSNNYIKYESKEFRIGVVIPLSGIRSYFGVVMKYGIDMAVEDINKSGVLRKKLVCYFKDDEGDPEKTRKLGMDLVKKDNVSVLIGSYSNLCTLSLCDIAENTKTPLLSPTSASELISTKGYKWVFRLNSPASNYAVTMLDFLTNVLRIKTIALLYEKDDFGLRTSEYIKKFASEMNCNIIFSEGYEIREKKFERIINRAKLLKPEAVLMISHLYDGLSLIKTFRKLDLNAKVYAGCGAGFAMTDFIKEGKKDAEYFFTLAQWSPQVDWPGVKEFTKEFTKKHGVIPQYHSAETYSAIQMIADCLKDNNSIDKNNLRLKLLETDAITVFGKIRFESFENYSNQNTHQLLIQQVQNGRFVLVWPPDKKKGNIIFPAPAWNKR